MSIKVMTRVWEHAPHKESTLLVLLALADYADDNGICWPDVASVAKKARITDRRVIDIIRSLEDDGSIAFSKGGGRGRRSCYAVLLGLTDEQKEKVKEIHRNYFSENKTLKQGVKGENNSPKKERKGELQRSERVNYSVNSQPGLTQQDAPNPEPIRHVDPSLGSVLEIRVGVDQEGTSPKSTPALFFETLAELCCIPMALATQKQRADLGSVAAKLNATGATVEQLAHFKAWWFSDSNWRTRKATETGRKPDAPRPTNVLEDWGNAMAIPVVKSNGTKPVDNRPPLPIVQPALDRPDPAESRRKTAEAIRQQRGT
jgi:hypothetical protein